MHLGVEEIFLVDDDPTNVEVVATWPTANRTLTVVPVATGGKDLWDEGRQDKNIIHAGARTTVPH